MINNKGISYVFVTLVMSVIFVLAVAILTMGLNDTKLSKANNNKSKAYYAAEAGVYYGGAIVLEAVQAMVEPASSISVDNPFSEYQMEHGFDLTITKEGSDYRVLSEGIYNGETYKVEALVTIAGASITYNQMKKTS